MKKVLLAVLVFCIMQALVGVVMVVPMAVAVDSSTNPTWYLSLALIVSGFLSFLICWKGLKTIEFPQTFSCANINWKWASVAILGSLMGIIAGDLMSEMIELPNVIEDMVLKMAKNFWGIMAIAVVGPIVEELIFREGICGYLIRSGSNHWRAIWISAILFGIIHFNPAQIPFAILMGIILGIIYVKTGNIVITSIIHILNNSIAMIDVNVLGDKVKEFSLVEWVGGPVVAGVCIIAGATLCAIILRKFWERGLTPNPSLVGEGNLSEE